MAWLKRQYNRSIAELTESITRLEAELDRMAQDPSISNEAYDDVQDFVDAQREARRVVRDRWETRHWTAADQQSWRLVQQNID